MTKRRRRASASYGLASAGLLGRVIGQNLIIRELAISLFAGDDAEITKDRLDDLSGEVEQIVDDYCEDFPEARPLYQNDLETVRAGCRTAMDDMGAVLVILADQASLDDD